VGVLWKIATGLGIPFAELLDATPQPFAVLRRHEAQVLRSPDGKFESRPLVPAGATPLVELYELKLAPRSVHAAEPHSPGTREIIVVLRDQPARNHLRLDFRRALEDVEDARVAQDAADLEFQGIAVAAVNLERGIGIESILQVNAAPGFSEHHSGRALDIGCPGYAHLEEEFEQSPAFAWLQRRGGEFGFRMSFPRNNSIGVLYEPWHWYYEGVARN
jgi:hypothetical protein